MLTAYEQVEAVVGAEPPPTAWRLKPELHENQRIAIERFNVAIDRLNLERQRKYTVLQEDAHLSEDAAQAAFEATLTLLPRFESDISSPYRSALDITVLDNVLRTWPGADGAPVYGRLPAKAAQQVLFNYKAGWSGFFEASKRFAAGGSAMTGKPQPPRYLAPVSYTHLTLPTILRV